MTFKIVHSDIFSEDIMNVADAICFTSNGIVKANGELVMGAGSARAFTYQIPGIAKTFGRLIFANGNHVQFVNVVTHFQNETKKMFIFNFPTKEDFKDESNIDLIKRSCVELMKLIDDFNLKNVYLPAPGVGFGKLTWENVEQEIKTLLDDRITIIMRD